MSDTPETDTEAITPSGFEDDEVPADFARKLERERDEAREYLERQRLEIVRLNGATNHAGGTPLKIALRERDEAREALDCLLAVIGLTPIAGNREALQEAVDQGLVVLRKMEDLK